MAATVCRVLEYEEADGSVNMALDELMLEGAIEDPETAWLRTYGWSMPTLSLGYFQKYAEVEADPRWSGVSVVRRPTGGGAIFHHHELTYAVALPKVHPLAANVRELYHTLHLALVDLLRAAGLPAGLRGEVLEKNRKNRPFLCFTDRSAEDILTFGVKVVGSSQRRSRGAVLQHGSLLLTVSSVTPDLRGAADLAPISSNVRFWAVHVQQQMPVALGLLPQRYDLTPGERLRAEALARDIYRNPSWIRRH
jgi:lipoate-protein ligase A